MRCQSWKPHTSPTMPGTNAVGWGIAVRSIVVAITPSGPDSPIWSL